LIARAADGSLRDALSLLDQAIAYCGGKLEEGPVAGMLGTIDRDHVSRLIGLLAAGDAKGIIEALRVIDDQFPDYARLLEDLARVLQQIAVFQVVGSVDSEDDVDDATLAEHAAAISPADVQLFYQTALIGRRDLHLAPDPKSGTEMTLLRMLAFRPAEAASGGSQAGGGGVNIAGSKASEKPAEAVAKVVRANWQDPDWSVLVARLGLGGADRLLAGSCAYLRREGNTVYFSLDPGSESYLTRPRKENLARALSDHFGESLTIDISIGKVEVESPMQAKSREAEEHFAAERAKLEADPNVQALKDMFGAELKSDSIRLNDPPQSE